MFRVFFLSLAVSCLSGLAHAERCELSSQHAGVSFQVEKIDPEWTCKLQLVIGDYTTATKVGPFRAAMSESMYEYLLGNPPLAAALINRLDFAPYKAESRGSGRYRGDDGEGTEGAIDLVYSDPTSRIYYVEGTHQSRLLPNISGKAVLFLRMKRVDATGGGEAMESTMVSYMKVNNRVVAGLLSLLRPLIGEVVSRKLSKGVEVVNRLGLEMRDHPERVLFEATDPPPFADEDVAFLTKALGNRPHPSPAAHPSMTKP